MIQPEVTAGGQKYKFAEKRLDLNKVKHGEICGNKKE